MINCKIKRLQYSLWQSTEQFLQVQQIGFVTLGPLRHA